MTRLRVLLIEDNEDDATIILRELRRAGYEAVAERVATAGGLRAALARQAWDLVSCDCNLPGFGALAALALIREHDGNVAVVVVAEEIGQELTVSLIRAGADDLVLKHNLGRLPGAVEHARRAAENRRCRSAAEAALQEEARISAALARIGQECVAAQDTTALLQRVCRSTAELLGCDYSHTALWDPEEQVFTVVAGHDTPDHWERVRALKLPLALVADRVAQLKQNGIVEAGPAELARDPGGVIIATAAAATASLYVPLWRGEELIGVHAAGYRRPVEGFAPWQRRVAAGIGHLTSLALDNAHLLNRLTRADRIKSEFLAIMSHELRTPLNHIIGFNDLLLEEAEQFTAEQADMLQTIGRSGRDVLALVNGILDVQRLEAERLPLAQPATDVAELVRQVTTPTARLTDSKDLQVICELPPELPAVHTDPGKLKAVLRNLIINAVKFTPRGSVTISAEPEGDGVLFTVADTGVGIPHEVLPFIFEPFRQGDASLTRQHGGVGLCLYIVRREVERLGGEVTVESEVGRGSTFRVWIPCEQRPRTKVAAGPQTDASTLSAEFFDATSDLVHTATPDGRLLYANRGWRAALGYESDELCALCLDDIVHPQSRAAFQQARQRALGGDPIHGLRVKYIAKDGRTVELKGSIRCRFANGEPFSMLCVYQNVTEHAEAQRQAEERFALAVRGSKDGIWDWDLTTRELYFSSRWKQMLGLPEHATGELWRPRVHPDDVEKLAAAVAPILDGASDSFECEHRLLHADGTYRWTLARGVVLRDATGKPYRMAGSQTDITERKQAEEALREARASLEIAVMAARAGLWDWDLQTGETHYSESWRTFFGYTAAEFDGSMEAWSKIVHPDDLERLAGSTSAATAIADPAAHYAEEFRLRHKDGTYHWVLSRATVLRDATGTPQRMVGAHVDITDQQQMKLALQEAEASLQLATESAKVAVWKCNLRTLTIRFSSGWKRVLGREESTLTLAALWDLVHPDDRAKTTEAMQEYLQGRAAAYETEQRMLHADGSYRWVLSRGVVTHDTAGRPAHWFGADIDVTERKRIELALQEAQTSAQLAAESAKVAVWRSDLRTLTIRYSSGWKRVLGRDEGEIPLATLWDLVHPDDRDRAIVAMQEHFHGRTSLYENEQRMLHADGSYRWVLTRSTIAYDIEGRPCGQYGADIDITERKALEEALRRSEEEYRHLVEDITDIIYTADREGRVTYMSPVAERLYGYAPVEVLDRPFSDFIFPEDLPGVVEGFRAAVSGNPQPHDHRIVTKAGDVRWVRNHTRTIMKDGQIVGLRGVMSDVTERRRAEDALRALTATLEQQVAERTRQFVAVNERLQLITDNMLDLLSQVSLEWVFQYVSPAHERVLGYAPQQLVGKSVLDFLHPDDIAPVTAIIEAAIRNASSGQAEFRFRHADGHYVWLETVGRLLLDDHGVPVGAVLNGRDVTERKQAEEEIRRRSEELARFNRLAVGRELRMIELKQQANDLARQLGKAPPYPLAFLRAGDGPPADHLDADGSALPGSGPLQPKASTKA